ncbi:MAG: hypothetical protein U1E96_09670 [Azonexus sp.]
MQVEFRKLAQHSGWGLLGLALLLLCLQATHDLPSGYGIEDLFSFTDTGAIHAANSRWAPVQVYGIAYVAIDLVAFIPLYAFVTLQLVASLREQAEQHSAEQRVLRYCGSIIIAFLAALLGIDIVETAPGLVRLDYSWIAAICTAISAGGLWLLARHWLPGEEHEVDRIGAVVGLAVAFGWVVFGQTTSTVCGSKDYLLSIGCVAHKAKPIFMWAWVGALTTGSVIWFSGAWAQPAARVSRSRMRAVLFDVVARSRYIVLGLSLLALLLLGLDQCRDVLLGTVSAVTSSKGSGSHLVRFATVVVSIVAVWTLSHTCWLWSRVMSRIPGPTSIFTPLSESERKVAETIARAWARALGAAPLVIFVLLTSQSLSALAGTALARNPSPEQAQQVAGEMWVLFIAAMSAFFIGATFQFTRERIAKSTPNERYYDDPAVLIPAKSGANEDMGKVRLAQWKGRRWNYWFILPNAPVWLPLASLFALVLVRAPVGLGFENAPPMGLPILAFAFSTWIGVFGWVSVLERRYAMPWGLIPLILAGVWSAFGLADNHIVEPLASHAMAGTLALWAASTALAIILCIAAWWFVARAPDLPAWRQLIGVLTVFVLVFGLLWITDQSFHREESFGGKTFHPSVESTARSPDNHYIPLALRRCDSTREKCLESALIGWLGALKSLHKKDIEKKVEVYFVASEGGGSRAAYWTAHVLDWLSTAAPASAMATASDDKSLSSLRSDQFLAHTFAISGVSGGSVGAAAFVACDGSDIKRSECLKHFDGTDLISPLLGAWFFEDVVARILPTSWCKTPGCGFLSRGIWFESTLAKNVEPMARGLLNSRKDEFKRPYLFLNSTRVESGARIIASEMRIDPYSFPGALGEYESMGTDLSMATVAHNSARFPFTNPIGLVMSKDCPDRDDNENASAGDQMRKARRCLHLADGGYFDNGGGQTVIDVMRGLRRLLSADKTPDEAVKWAKQHIDPKLILIHNGIKGQGCKAPDDGQATQDSVMCERNLANKWAPEVPNKAFALSFSADALGPLVTALFAGGLNASRDRADALTCEELAALKATLGLSGNNREVLRFAQQEDGQSYPLGWYLSGNARDAMDRQVANLQIQFMKCGEVLPAS